MKEFKKNTKGYQILTPTGYQDFGGLANMGTKKIYRLNFEDGGYVDATHDHRFIAADMKEIAMMDLSVGMVLKGLEHNRIVLSVIDLEISEEVFDVLDVANGNHFYANGTAVHNCEMVSSDALLISSLVLQNIKFKEAIDNDHGFNFYGKPRSNMKYFVGMDVATGVGADFSVIQVLEFPSMIQLAEFRNNKVSMPQLYAVMKWIIKYLVSNRDGNSVPEIYWSFENNGVGQGITTLYQNDDSFPDAGMLLSDDNRIGINTNGKNKILACMELKNLIEKQKSGIIINSQSLLAELKNYVVKGGSYAAKSGATDDSIAAMLIVIQMLKKFANFDQDAFDIIYDYGDMDNFDNDVFGENPIPMIF